MKIEELKALEAKATKAWVVVAEFNIQSWRPGLHADDVVSITSSSCNNTNAQAWSDFNIANARLAAALRNAAPALLAIAETVKAAVEAGAVDEIYLSLLRDQLAALEDAR